MAGRSDLGKLQQREYAANLVFVLVQAARIDDAANAIASADERCANAGLPRRLTRKSCRCWEPGQRWWTAPTCCERAPHHPPERK